MPPGVRDLRRPDRASRPAGQRAGHQDPEQPALHRQPRQRDEHPRAGRIPRHPPQSRLAEVLNGGSATSKALGSIAIFGGTVEGLAPIAGALLQKDVRHAANIADTASAPEGVGVRRGRRRAEVDGPSAMTSGRLRRSGPHGRAHGAPPRRRRPRGPRARSDRREAARRSANSGAQPVAELADVAAGADVVIVCVFTDEQVRQVCLDSDLLSAMDAGRGRSSSTPPEARAPRETIAAEATRGVDVVDAPVSGGPHDIAAGEVTLFVGRLRRRRRAGPARAGQPTATRSCTSARSVPGQAVKLVNNTLFAAQIGLLHEAVRLGDRLGVDEAEAARRDRARQRGEPGGEHRRRPWIGRRVHRHGRRVHRQGRRRGA